jgi:hypothetical protein
MLSKTGLKLSSHCTWTWNCIGVDNHRQFLLFVGSLIVGIILFDRLTFACKSHARRTHPLILLLADFVQKTPTPTEPSDLCLFPTFICAAARFNTFHFVLTVWATLQLTWTFIVLAGQAYQVTRQLTTYELSNLGRYGYMGGRGGQSLSTQNSHPAITLAPGQEEAHGSSCPRHAHSHHGHQRKGALVGKILPAGLLSILGLDLYTKGKAAEGIQLASQNESKRSNPFDYGVWRNCADFWMRGRYLGVDYTSVSR